MNAEWDSKGGVQKLDAATAVSVRCPASAELQAQMNCGFFQLLSYLDIVALRVDVLKRGRRLIARRVDERFAHAVAFCEEMCGTVDPKWVLFRVIGSIWMRNWHLSLIWPTLEAGMCRSITAPAEHMPGGMAPVVQLLKACPI